ncbi:DNA alkylation response protein, partial [Streptomyces sp. NPDC050528]
MARTTHTVTNQTPPLVGYDVFTADRVLTEAVERHIPPGLLDEVRDDLSALGRAAGSAQLQEWGGPAHPPPPRPRPPPPGGPPKDQVEVHTARHPRGGKGGAPRSNP